MHANSDDWMCVFYEGKHMMDFKNYLIRLTAAAIIAALIRRIAPAGGAGRAARLGAGLLVLLTAFGPLAQVDTVSAAENLAKNAFSDPLTTEDFSVETNNLLSDLISQEAETYILDKAQDVGLSLTVEVETRVVDTYPVPWSVTIRGSPTQQQQAELSQIIDQDLGIPEERQEWWSM